LAHAYTPGLQVIDRLTLTKVRTLPVQGEVLVKEGDKVTADTVVARTELPNEVVSVNVVNLLSIRQEEIHDFPGYLVNLFIANFTIKLQELGDELRDIFPALP